MAKKSRRARKRARQSTTTTQSPAKVNTEFNQFPLGGQSLALQALEGELCGQDALVIFAAIEVAIADCCG